MARTKPLLTQSMVKILARHASGLSLKEVAQEIYVSYSAVTNTLYDARDRTGCKTNTQLTMFAHKHGFLSGPTGPSDQVFPVSFEN
jgi:DNA-binding NarL/FixJ family response regulator